MVLDQKDTEIFLTISIKTKVVFYINMPVIFSKKLLFIAFIIVIPMQ